MWDYDDEDYRRADPSEHDRWCVGVCALLLVVCAVIAVLQ